MKNFIFKSLTVFSISKIKRGYAVTIDPCIISKIVSDKNVKKSAELTRGKKKRSIYINFLFLFPIDMYTYIISRVN